MVLIRAISFIIPVIAECNRWCFGPIVATIIVVICSRTMRLLVLISIKNIQYEDVLQIGI